MNKCDFCTKSDERGKCFFITQGAREHDCEKAITSAKLDGWGDGLVTNVTLEVRVSSMKYHDEKIKKKTIDEFVSRLKDVSFPTHENYSAIWLDSVDEIAEQMRGEPNE